MAGLHTRLLVSVASKVAQSQLDHHVDVLVLADEYPSPSRPDWTPKERPFLAALERMARAFQLFRLLARRFAHRLCGVVAVPPQVPFAVRPLE